MKSKTNPIQYVRGELRERRSHRAEYRALKAALAAYRSPTEINDLFLLAEAESGDTSEVREILSGNLQRYQAAHAGRVGGLRYSA